MDCIVRADGPSGALSERDRKPVSVGRIAANRLVGDVVEHIASVHREGAKKSTREYLA